MIHQNRSVEHLFYKSKNRFKIKQLLTILWINEEGMGKIVCQKMARIFKDMTPGTQFHWLRTHAVSL